MLTNRFYPDVVDLIREAQERDYREARRQGRPFAFPHPRSRSHPRPQSHSRSQPYPFSSIFSSNNSGTSNPTSSSYPNSAEYPDRRSLSTPSTPRRRGTASLRHRLRTYRDSLARSGLDQRTEAGFGNFLAPPPPPFAHQTYHYSLSETSLDQEGDVNMSRPGQARPTHIPLPPGGHTPIGTPLPTPGVGGAASPTSPRHSFLGFMRGRGRSATLTHGNTGANSPTMERGNPLTASASRGGSSREASMGPSAGEGGGGVTRSLSTPLSGGLNIGLSTVVADTPTTAVQPPTASLISPTDNAASATAPGKTYRIRLVPNLDSNRSLAFDPVVRELMPIIVPPGTLPAIAAASVSSVGPLVNGRPPALVLKIGRFTDKSAANPPVLSAGGAGSPAGGSSAMGPNGGRSGPATLTLAGGGGDMTSGKVAFKSKVVSRSHAEIWCEPGGKFFIRDSSSSSGTFLNHIRLSSPNTDSRPMMLNDGDMLQLGVDYQGGNEEMFRCVKMRVEIGREWQRGANEFNTNALKQLNALGGVPSESQSSNKTPSKKAKASVTDCCICLFSVTVCQSLFIAPCSHVFHYKCIRPLLVKHYPGFSCPLCRTFANLEEDVETEDAWEIASRRASIMSRRPSTHSIRLPPGDATSPTSADGNSNSNGNGNDDAGPSQAPPPGVAESSTGIINFNSGPAMVDDLVGGNGGNGSTEEGGPESEGMIGSSALARQTTAVAPTTTAFTERENGLNDIEMPELREEEEVPLIAPPLHADPAIEGSLAVLNNPDVLQGITTRHEDSEDMNGDTLRNPISTSLSAVPVPVPPVLNPHTFAELSFSEAATPRNETFLSTLAFAPGVHQRLDLAAGSAAGAVTSNGTEEDGDTPRTRPARLSGHADASAEDDVDMMYS